jgi:thymidylate kinase
MVKLIILDNLLAGGKTTLINKLLQRNPDWFYINEGVPLTRGSIIDMSNMDHRKYSEQFIQTKIALQYEDVLSKVNNDEVILVDRIFSSTKYWSKIHNVDFNDYSEFLIEQIKHLLKDVEIFYIYLKDPTPNQDILLRNIKSRKRDFELNYTSQDLISMNKIYSYAIEDLQGLNYTYHEIVLGLHFYKNGCEMIEKLIFSRQQVGD